MKLTSTAPSVLATVPLLLDAAREETPRAEDDDGPPSRWSR
jgi:hypothetical protein